MPEICVVFGWRDAIIPAAHGIQFAQACRAALHVLDGSHLLNAMLPEEGTLFKGFLNASPYRTRIVADWAKDLCCDGSVPLRPNDVPFRVPNSAPTTP